MSNTHLPSLGRFASNTWLVTLLAVLELILGFILLSFPYLLGASAVWVGGFVLIVVGVMRLIEVFSSPMHKGWNLLAFAVYFCLGLMMIFMTGPSMALLTLLIGVALLVGGALRLGVAISMRREPGTAWRFFNAIISLLLGVMVVWSWPGSSVWLIGTIIAVEMIFSGWTLLFLALSPGKTR